jgi:histidinol-phosphate aminotransferase
MNRPRPLAHLDALRPYQAAGGFVPRYNLSANEAFLGPSGAAAEALEGAAGDLFRYPDGACTALREAIAVRYELTADKIICTAGSEELISLIVQAFVAPGKEVLFSQYGFIKYELAARAYGAEPVRASEVAFTANVGSLLAAVTVNTRVLFLANPNNPTGTQIIGAELRELRDGLRSDILLVVDAAYAEFVEDVGYEDGLALAGSTANTLALRTFSKIHGLAALRCGWGYGDLDLVNALHKVRGAFNVSAPAQIAATAAIQDQVHEASARAHNTRWRAWLAAQLTNAGYRVCPSATNFLMVVFDDAQRCQDACAQLRRHGVLALSLGGYGLPQAMRITVGTEDANRTVVRALCEPVT